jgi:hypothetical protein
MKVIDIEQTRLVSGAGIALLNAGENGAAEHRVIENFRVIADYQEYSVWIGSEDGGYGVGDGYSCAKPKRRSSFGSAEYSFTPTGRTISMPSGMCP